MPSRDPPPPLSAARRLGAFVFEPDTPAIVACGGARWKLTRKEGAILAYLLDADGRTVGRLELLTEIWGYSPETATHTVETHIYRLRRKLREACGDAQMVVWDGEGYRLDLPRARAGGASGPAAAGPTKGGAAWS